MENDIVGNFNKIKIIDINTKIKLKIIFFNEVLLILYPNNNKLMSFKII